jgi:hypothetical protein
LVEIDIVFNSYFFNCFFFLENAFFILLNNPFFGSALGCAAARSFILVELSCFLEFLVSRRICWFGCGTSGDSADDEGLLNGCISAELYGCCCSGELSPEGLG